jgi:hypothetical protein
MMESRYLIKLVYEKTNYIYTSHNSVLNHPSKKHKQENLYSSVLKITAL